MALSNRIVDSLNLAGSSDLRSVTLARGTVLHASGAAIRHVYFPTSGMVSLLAVMKSGDQVEMAVVGREGVVGGSIGNYGKLAFGQATVQVAGTALRMTTEAFAVTFKANTAFRAAINAYLAVIMVQTQQSAACHALHTVEARLSRWLLHSRDAIESDEIRLTQEFLSHMLGVQRAAVSIAAIALQNAGLIRYSRGNIRVLDRAGISTRSCECYDAVRVSSGRFLKGLNQKN